MMTQDKHIVMGSLSVWAANAVVRYHNDLFHNGHAVGKYDKEEVQGTYLVWCPVCPSESPVDEELTNLFARAGFGMDQKAQWYWTYEREPDGQSVDEWRTTDGEIFAEYSVSVDIPPSEFRCGRDQVKGYLENEALPTKRYRILILDSDTPPTEMIDEIVIEAPSPGVALEFCLAIHGMIRYDRALIEETDQEPDETIGDIAQIVRKPFTLTMCKELDAHHHWEPWVKESF